MKETLDIIKAYFRHIWAMITEFATTIFGEDLDTICISYKNNVYICFKQIGALNDWIQLYVNQNVLTIRRFFSE